MSFREALTRVRRRAIERFTGSLTLRFEWDLSQKWDGESGSTPESNGWRLSVYRGDEVVLEAEGNSGVAALNAMSALLPDGPKEWK